MLGRKVAWPLPEEGARAGDHVGGEIRKDGGAEAV